MGSTLVQKAMLGFGVACVLGCGCAAPFHPVGWNCYDLKFDERQSLEYCSFRMQKSNTCDEGICCLEDRAGSQPDPFLAMDE